MGKWVKTLMAMMVLSLILTACGQQDIEVEGENIENYLDEESIDFSKFFPSDWDTIFIFHPYTSLESIQETIGTKFKYETTIEYSDAINLVIAMKDQKVVNYSEVSRHIIDFDVTEVVKITNESPTIKR